MEGSSVVASFGLSTSASGVGFAVVASGTGVTSVTEASGSSEEASGVSVVCASGDTSSCPGAFSSVVLAVGGSSVGAAEVGSV